MVLASARGTSNPFRVLRVAKRLRYHVNYKPPLLTPPDVCVIHHRSALVPDHLGHGSAGSEPLRGTCLLQIKGLTKVGRKSD